MTTKAKRGTICKVSANEFHADTLACGSKRCATYDEAKQYLRDNGVTCVVCSTLMANGIIVAGINIQPKAAESRKMRDQAMRDLGLTKVRGAMGGTYWE